MERTQVFVSYSSQDSEWRDRLLLHLAPLERRATIHVWSDTQIDAGANWKEEIEKALRKAGAAVLLVTPAFLASEFIWTEEMPRILKHRESGMLVFPLIVKACAWQLESALERIQARPKGVRPLALASEAEVDRDLAEFIRELAAAVSSVTERTETLPQVTGATELKDQAGQRVKGIWQGTYDSTNRKLRLVVDEESGSTFSGRMEYVNENVCTRVSGKIRSDTPPAGRSTRDWTITFRESVDAAHGVVETRGEYRASLSGQRMKGEWISDRGKRSLGRFEFWRIDDEDLA